MEAGVYLISNSVNGKCYVGSTIHLDQRRKEHFSRLANNKHAKHIKEGQTGKSLTEEHKQKLSKAAKHRKSPSNHAIISIDGIIYNSLKEVELSIILFRRDLKTRTSQTITMLSLELYLLKN